MEYVLGQAGKVEAGKRLGSFEKRPKQQKWEAVNLLH